MYDVDHLNESKRKWKLAEIVLLVIFFCSVIIFVFCMFYFTKNKSHFIDTTDKAIEAILAPESNNTVNYELSLKTVLEHPDNYTGEVVWWKGEVSDISQHYYKDDVYTFLELTSSDDKTSKFIAGTRSILDFSAGDLVEVSGIIKGVFVYYKNHSNKQESQVFVKSVKIEKTSQSIAGLGTPQTQLSETPKPEETLKTTPETTAEVAASPTVKPEEIPVQKPEPEKIKSKKETPKTQEVKKIKKVEKKEVVSTPKPKETTTAKPTPVKKISTPSAPPSSVVKTEPVTGFEWHYSKIAELDKKYFAVASSYDKAGNKKKALVYYKKYLKIAPQGEKSGFIEQRIKELENQK